MENNEFSNLIEQVRARNNIVDVCSRYVPVKKIGGRHWACCPIHHESNPSFTLSEDKGTFFCYGCREHGDVFKLVMTLESCSFMDAVRMLAERAGIEMPEFKPGVKTNEYKEKQDRLYEIMIEAAKHYHENLYSEGGWAAKEYAIKRGLDEATIKAFRMGYSLGYNEVVDCLTAKGYNRDEMLDAGICAEKNGKLYDAFYQRLIIPIFNKNSKVIAFGGRYLGEGDFAKYKNSKETAIFKKHEEIFGINNLKNLKIKSGLSSIIVVEGYMDVISLYKAGFRNVCASMGTALTPGQCKQLKFLCDKVYLCYDGDSAGQRATYKGIEVLREAGLNAKIIVLEDNLDPDEYVKKFGAAKFAQKLENAIAPTQYQIMELAKRYDLTKPDERASFAIEATRAVAQLENAAERAVYLEQVADYSKIGIESLSMQMKEGNAMALRTKSRGTASDKSNKFILAARVVLYALYTNSPYISSADIDAEYFENADHKAVFNSYIMLKELGESIDIEQIARANINRLESAAIVAEGEKTVKARAEVYYKACLEQLRKEFAIKQRDALNEQLMLVTDDDKREEIYKMMNDLNGNK